MTGAPPTQLPAPSQASVRVQELASLQAKPSSFGTLATQTPVWQTSWLHGWSTPQSVPSALLTVTQAPVLESQATLVWQAVGAGQLLGEPAQAPAVQTSLTVQGSPSSQTVAFALSGWEQTPVAALQVPTA